MRTWDCVFSNAPTGLLLTKELPVFGPSQSTNTSAPEHLPRPAHMGQPFWHRLQVCLENSYFASSSSSHPRASISHCRRGGAAPQMVQSTLGGKGLVFEFQPSIKEGVSDSMAALGGPFVQGPPKQRFVYLDIGAYAGQADSRWGRRLKVPLAGIPAKFLRTGGVLEARIPGTGRDGGPNCATVTDFDGWASQTIVVRLNSDSGAPVSSRSFVLSAKYNGQGPRRQWPGRSASAATFQGFSRASRRE